MRISDWSSDVCSSDLFGSEEVQAWGVAKTAQLLAGRKAPVHWYSLYDLPQEWGATTRHKEAEGSSYYRHFHMGLLRADGSPKAALPVFAQLEGQMGICQWFNFEDPRLADAVNWLRRLGELGRASWRGRG